jgi:23S rRNA (cytidine1920-2'-O)/16S rRNA (cytidine1409-2'-O)-methyltransferase
MVKRGLVSSRSEAARLIEEDAVTVAGSPALKASRLVAPDEPIEIVRQRRYVSRGGEKLEGAVSTFGIALSGRSVVDAGSSTGGFTDCLLQHGAGRVFAVDVGRNQLHERIAGDARVTWREGTNIRDMGPTDLPFACSLLVADLSFISLVTVLPAMSRLVTADGAVPAEMVLLVKPQFEVGREEASRGRGVITDPVLHRASVDKIAGAAVGLGWTVAGEMESPLKGQDGNTEFLLHLRDAGRS